MCCPRLPRNAGRKKLPKIRRLGNHHTTLLDYIFTTKARIDNRKKLVEQQYLPHLSPQYGKLQPTSGGDRLVSLGHPS